MVFPQNYGFQF